MKLKFSQSQFFRKRIRTNPPQPTGFVWSCRYSFTDAPDKQGRWARTCHYRGYMIAWVDRIKYDDHYIYTVNDYFPSSGNTNLCNNEICFYYNKAQAGVERRFLKFLETCR